MWEWGRLYETAYKIKSTLEALFVEDLGLAKKTLRGRHLSQREASLWRTALFLNACGGRRPLAHHFRMLARRVLLHRSTHAWVAGERYGLLVLLSS